MQIHFLQEKLGRLKAILIFLVFSSLFFSIDAFSFDIFGRDEREDNSFYRKEKAFSDAEESYLAGDFEKTINICESISRFYRGKDKIGSIYYLEGLSYLKLKKAEKARSAFEKILSISQKGDYNGPAKLGIADSYLIERNYEKAKELYKKISSESSLKNLHSTSYYRLVQISKKLGNKDEASDYLNKLTKDFPQSFEALAINEGCDISEGENFIQVGSFKEKSNADRACNKLIANGFNASVSKAEKKNSVFYRVIVKPQSQDLLSEIVSLLKEKGYPTKICP